MWASAGTLTTPAIGTILADTGSLSAGVFTFTIYVWADVIVDVAVNHVVSGSVLTSQRITSNSGFSYVPFTFTVASTDHITLTLISVAASTGNTFHIQASFIGT